MSIYISIYIYTHPHIYTHTHTYIDTYYIYSFRSPPPYLEEHRLGGRHGGGGAPLLEPDRRNHHRHGQRRDADETDRAGAGAARGWLAGGELFRGERERAQVGGLARVPEGVSAFGGAAGSGPVRLWKQAEG